jgi:hypothetical protein
VAEELDAGGAGVAEAVAGGRDMSPPPDCTNMARIGSPVCSKKCSSNFISRPPAASSVNSSLSLSNTVPCMPKLRIAAMGAPSGRRTARRVRRGVLAVGRVVLAAAVAVDEIVGVPVVGGGGAPLGGSEVGDGGGDDLGEAGGDAVDDLLVGAVGADGRERGGQAPVAGDVVVRVGGGGDDAAAEVDAVASLSLVRVPSVIEASELMVGIFRRTRRSPSTSSAIALADAEP